MQYGGPRNGNWTRMEVLGVNEEPLKKNSIKGVKRQELKRRGFAWKGL
jgi:hypothetical protein